jgi:hypothetical protein
MARKLEILANVGFLTVCVLLAGVLGRQLLWPSAPALAGPAPPVNAIRPAQVLSQPGDRLTLENVDFSKAEKTLLLVIRSTCKYCTDSMPFYRALAGQRPSVPKLRIVAVSPDDVPISLKYLGLYRVQLDDVVKVPLSALKVRGTPTAILVDRASTIRQIWPGVMDEVRQKDLLRAINARP